MTSEWERHPEEALVWVWLPGEARPVPCGRLVDRGGIVAFAYGRRYLARPDRVALYEPELPLRAGAIMPARGEIAGCIADAGPDAWGRRVIERRRMVEPGGFSLLGYLLESGSDRVGALDVQRSATSYEPRAGEAASLAELAEATERVERGEALSELLHQALLHVWGNEFLNPFALYGYRQQAHLTPRPRRHASASPAQSPEYEHGGRCAGETGPGSVM